MKPISLIKDKAILIDTNVLIHAFSANLQEMKEYQSFVLNNKIYICDTVYYEFLRNCNLDKYRKRALLLESKFATIKTERDCIDFYPKIWTLYIYVLRNMPEKILSIDEADIRIAGCAIEKRYDSVLTANAKDFPDSLFTKEEYLLSLDSKNEQRYTLCIFKREDARKYWEELESQNYTFEMNMNNVL